MSARRAGEQGFSLVELAVASVVLSVVLLFVAQGLLEGQRQLADAQRTLTRGSCGLAFTLLRHDARSAVSVADSFPLWTGRPLVLVQPDGTTVGYRFTQRRIEREVFDREKRIRVRQVVARDVLAFRWQRPVAGLIDAEIELRSPPRPPRGLDRSAPRPADPPLLERATVALRSRARSGW